MIRSTKVSIPCTIELVETRPDLLEYQGKPIPRDRHSFKVKLPNGHTVEATITRMEMQKLSEIVPKFTVPEEEEEKEATQFKDP